LTSISRTNCRSERTPEQVPYEQRLEHHGWIERWPSIVRAIKPGNPIMDEGKIDRRLDLAKQVILRNQPIETYHLDCGLFRRRFLRSMHQ
jgi:hypothetical protein